MAGFWQRILFLEWIYWITHSISRWAIMGTEPNWENRLILSSFQGVCSIGGNTTRVHCTAFPGSLFSLWHTYSWINVSWVGNRYNTTDCPFPSQFKHFYPEPCVAGGRGEDTSGGPSLQDMHSWNVIHFNGTVVVKNPPAMRETWVRSLDWEDPLENGKATHSSILAWRIPWTASSMGWQRVGHSWATFTSLSLSKQDEVSRQWIFQYFSKHNPQSPLHACYK